MNFDRIKKNYDTRLWNKPMVRKAYDSNVITLLQYYMIVRDVEDEDIPEGMTKEEFMKYLDSLIIDG